MIHLFIKEWREGCFSTRLLMVFLVWVTLVGLPVYTVLLVLMAIRGLAK